MVTGVRPCLPAEFERLLALLDSEFIHGKGRAVTLAQRFPSVYCDSNLANILIGVDGSEIVSALAIRQFDWCAEGEIFQGAMIGAVCTHPARRREGWASRLLAAAATRLRDQGIDFGVLWTGQPEFYARLGWKAADCSVLGEIETAVCSSASLRYVPDDLQASSSRTTISAKTSDMAVVREHWLANLVVRHAEDYCQLPLPAERVDVLWREIRDDAAYALLGRHGTTGYLYEMVGHPEAYPALWQEACRGCSRVFVNDQAGSPSCRWLSEHTETSWQPMSLAMWLPLSMRMDLPRTRRWTIPYFDRI